MNVPARKAINSNFLRNLLTGLDVAKNTALLQELREQFGYDNARAAYEMPYDNFLAIIEYLRQRLLSDQDYTEAYQILGQSILFGFVKGPLGDIVKITNSLMGPVRGANLMVKNAARTFPFGRHELEEIREGYFRYHYYNIPGEPALICGLVKASFELSNIKSVQVSFASPTVEEAIIEVRW